MVVTAEDVRTDPLQVVKNIFAHLGVSDAFIPLALVPLIPPDEDEVKYKPGIIKRTIKLVVRGVKAVYKFVVTKINPPDVPLETSFAVAKRVPLSPELREFLIQYYREDVAVLSRLLHRNLSHEWGMEQENEDTENKPTR
jgi:hypothetical protein